MEVGSRCEITSGSNKKRRRDFDSLLGGCISLSDDKSALNVDINGENNVDVLER